MSALEGIDGFFAACGGRPAVRLLISTSDGEERDHGFPNRPFIILGRSARCDIQLEGSDVSHRHAYVQMIGHRIFCADLGSRSGVHWYNGIRPSGWLGLNEHVAIGQYSLRFAAREVEATAANEAETASLESRRPEVTLRFLNARVSTDRSRQWRISRTVTLLGHLRSCHIPLQDAGVSRVHASLVRTPFGLWVVDLLGKEGVEVNGERVTVARLAHADVLKIGRFQMAVEHTLSDVWLEPAPQFNGAAGNGHSLPADASRAIVVGSSPHAGELATHSVAQHATNDVASGFHGAPPQPTSGGLSEEFVLALLRQSASMQQQMVTQQNQMILLTMQMLSTMHSQHANLVREELGCVKALTDQIQQVQAKLARLPDATSNHGQQAIGHESAVAMRAEDSGGKPAEAATGIPKGGFDGVQLQSHLANRLAELERQRSSYWKKIARVIMG